MISVCSKQKENDKNKIEINAWMNSKRTQTAKCKIKKLKQYESGIDKEVH